MLPEKARVKTNDKETVAVRADPLLRTAAKLLKKRVLAAFKKDLPIRKPIAEGIETIKILFADAMTLAHIKAGVRVFENVPRAVKKLSAYDDAIGYWKARMQMSESEVERLRNKYAGVNVDVLKDAGDYVEKKAQKAIADIISQGMHVKEGMDYLDDALDRAGCEPKSPHLLETLVRTQIGIAYSAGQWQANQDPDVAGWLWGYEIKTVGDDRVRPTHAACEGLRLPKEDPTWERLWPPLFGDYNCRCVVLEVWNDDSEELRTENRVGGNVISQGQPFNSGILLAA